ncbi:MFS transporter [Bacillus cereus group sp. TH152-1LC]|uniref:MFS transporter n=1 Tax=Bacillus cereus group sp. TH152-1LC TaxID=3018060 RepID=UPI0022E69ABA|nr:MFS transporter [Bacillus cereus group sp. TH152-1LC]MDA1677500.1 MFS transporter [Bacillus cereus group sp. TH152-1LC]
MQTGADYNQNLRTELSQLFENKQFVNFICSHGLQGLIFTSFVVTEQWLVVNELKASAMLGVVMMAATIPRLIMMLIGGTIIDRFNSKNVMLFSNFTRIFILCLEGVLFLNDLLTLPVLICLAVIFGLLDAIFFPATMSLVPKIVSKDLLTRVNAIQRGSFQVLMMMGGVLAAFVISIGSFASSFFAMAGIILVSSLFLVRVNVPKDEDESINNSKKKSNESNKKKKMFEDLVEGYKYINKHSNIGICLIILLLTNLFFVGPIGIAIPLIVEKMLNGDAFILSLYQGTWAAGLLVGSVASILLNLNKNRLKRSVALLAIQGTSLVIIGTITVIWVHLGIILIVAICASLISVPIISYIQENTEKQVLGRVMSLLSASSMGILPIAYSLVSGAISIGFGVSIILQVSGGILMAYCIYLAFNKRLVSRVSKGEIKNAKL